MFREVGSYNIIRELGRGATAQVALARRRPDQKPFALKIFHPGVWARPELRSRVISEFHTLSQLTHPAIVQVEEALWDLDPPVVVMEYVPGHSLEEFQARLPYILPEVSLALIAEVLGALEHAHSRGVIHRDLKPANILVSESGRVLVSDFGLAKVKDLSQHTMTGAVLGSPDYMSPEQARGEICTPASDLFSTASILYFLVTGTRPFARNSALATLAAVNEARPEPAHHRNPKLSPALSELIARGMAREPRDRFASAAEFRKSVNDYLQSVGLVGFLFSEWNKAPAEQTMNALKRIADHLTQRSESHIGAGQWEEALTALSHLSQVAPESATIPRLLATLEKRKKDRRRKKILLPLLAGTGALTLASAIVLGGLQASLRKLSPPQPVVTAAAVAASVPVATPDPIEAPVLVAPPAAVEPTPLPRPPRQGTVRFRVPEGISVYWNGKPINPNRPLTAQPEGTYQLRMEKPGAEPIIQSIRVRAGDPVLIQVQ